jgi:hypothetical protein
MPLLRFRSPNAPGVRLATDTFFVRDRKIMVQTFAASLAA